MDEIISFHYLVVTISVAWCIQRCTVVFTRNFYVVGRLTPEQSVETSLVDPLLPILLSTRVDFGIMYSAVLCRREEFLKVLNLDSIDVLTVKLWLDRKVSESKGIPLLEKNLHKLRVPRHDLLKYKTSFWCSSKSLKLLVRKLVK